MGVGSSNWGLFCKYCSLFYLHIRKGVCLHVDLLHFRQDVEISGLLIAIEGYAILSLFFACRFNSYRLIFPLSSMLNIKFNYLPQYVEPLL
jgi:hypothetical protein